MKQANSACFAIAIIGIAVGAASGQPVEDRPVPEFLRVFAPADRISEWPLEGDKYLPIEAEEFERLVDLMERGQWGVAATSRCRIERLTGAAKVAQELLRGSVTLDVVHDGGGPALLSLAPWRLAMTDARWESPQPESALCGLTSSGRTGVVVHRSGRLRIDFSLRGRSTVNGDWEYKLDVPHAVAAVWDVEIPANRGMTVDGGLVSMRGSEPMAYHIDSPPGETVRLLIHANDSSRQRAPFASITQTLTYGLSTNGVEVVSEFGLDDIRESPARLVVSLDPELEPVSVQIGQRALAFRRTTDKAGQTSIEMETPPVLSANDVLRITAWCPLRTGQRWAMPQLSIEGAAWNDATINVLLPEPLGLTQIFPTYGLLQTRVSRLSAPLAGDSLTFDCYSAAARLELRVDFREPRVVTSSGTTVEVGPRETTARMHCDVQVANGEVFELRGRVTPGWLIDDISSTPEQRVREIERDPQDAGRIIVRLNTAIKARQSLRLIVNARRLNPRVGEMQPLLALEPVAWEQASSQRRLFSLRSSGEQRWRLRTSDDADILSREQLGNAESELLLPAAEETLVALNGEDGGASASVEPRPHGLRAESVAEFTASLDQLEERYELRCDPEQGSVDGLLVRFSQRRDSPLSWSCESTTAVSVTASKIEDESGEPPTTTETWLVRLWPPQSAPFTLRASRRGPATNPAHLALVELPEAVADSGIARILADDSLALEIDLAGPQPSVPESRATEGVRATPRAEYRYEPARDVNRASPPALALTVRPRTEREAQAIVRNESIATTVSPDGDCLVTARYRFEAQAASTFQLDLPPSATLLRVAQEDRSIAFRQIRDTISVDVGQLDLRQELILEYSVPCTDRLHSGALEAILPRLKHRFHPRAWQIELPADLEIVGIDAPWQCSQLLGLGAVERLFGPLARAKDAWPVLPWRDVADMAEPSGNVYHIAGPSRSEPKLHVQARATSHRQTAYAALALALACWRLGRWRAVAWFGLPLLMAAVAIVVPAPFIPWGAGAFVGAVAGAFLGVAMRRQPTSIAIPAAIPDTAGSTTRTMVLGARHATWIALLLLASGGHAAEPATPTAAPRVYLPVDAEQRPTGGRYFVSEGLWRALQQRAAALGDERPEWIVTKAHYALGNNSRPVDASCTARVLLELHTFIKSAQVRLPCDTAFVSRVESTLLDGVPCQIAAGDGPADVSISVPEPGVHRLELIYPATVTELQDRTILEFAALAAPKATLQAWLTSEALASAETDGLGETVRYAADGYLTTELGPKDSLRLRLDRAARDASNGAPVELEQMLWLHIEPERVTADVRHQIVAADRPLGRLEMNFDPRWEPGRASNSPEGPRVRPDSPPGRTRLEWNTPGTVGERFTWQCQLRDRAGVGEIALPQVTPVGAVVRRRWCAVTIDPALETTSLANIGAGGPTPAQFTAAWGPTDVTPLHVFAWPIGGPPPNLQTAFIQSKLTADERLTATVRSDRLELRLDAAIDNTKSPVFTHQVIAPREFVVQTVDVEQDGVQQAVRWTRGAEGEIHVFLSEPTTGRHSLVVQGSIPLEPRPSVTLPQLSLADVELKSRVIHWERHRSALVDELSPAPRFGAETAAGTASPDPPNRPVGEWSLPQSLAAISFRLRPNLPRASAVQTLAVRDGETGLNAEVDCRLTVSDGTVDELRFDVARTWPGPFELEPAWPYSLLTTPTAQVQTLVVRPPNSLEGEQRLRISGPIATASGASITVPEVMLQGVSRLQRLVVLPDQLAGRRVLWSLAGLRPAQLPTGFGAPATAAINWKAYDVVGGSFQATSRIADQPLSQPGVRLASFTVRIEADGEYRGLATWALDPGGLSQLPLRLPTGAEALSCRVLGQSVDVRRNAADRWSIPLQSDQLPQQIELLYGGQIDPAKSQPAPAPEIPDAPVATSHWTVLGPLAGASLTAGQSTTALQQALGRCQTAAEMLELGVQRARLRGTPSSTDEGERWFSAFVESYAVTRAAASVAADESPDRAESRLASAELEKIDHRLATRFADRPSLAKSLAEANARAAALRESQSSDEGFRFAAAVSRSRLSGTGQPPNIGPGASFGRPWALRAACAAGLATLAFLLLRGGSVTQAVLASMRWPLGWWLALGLAWWLWLTPSVLGLLIMGYASWLIVRERRAGLARPEMAR